MASILLMALVSGCAASRPAMRMGWIVDPNYGAPTTMRMFLYGRADHVETVTSDARPFGWHLVERSILPTGSAFALLEAPVELQKGGNIDDIIGSRPVTFGPALVLPRRTSATSR